MAELGGRAVGGADEATMGACTLYTTHTFTNTVITHIYIYCVLPTNG